MAWEPRKIHTAAIQCGARFLALVVCTSLLAAAAPWYCAKTFTIYDMFDGQYMWPGFPDPTTFTPGTTYIFQDRLFDATNQTLGYTVGQGTAKDFDPVTYEATNFCTMDLVLTDIGAIATQGMFIDFTNATFKLAVLGGTGKFKGARGVVDAYVIQGGALWQYTVKLMDNPC